MAARPQVYLAWLRGPAANVKLLETMLAARHELAGLLGYSSYAAFRADDASLAGEFGVCCTQPSE